MKQIQACLNTYLNIETEIDSFGGSLYGSNGLITTLVVAPHEGNDYKWLLRLSPIVSFDRWANSMCIEEKFESSQDVCYYLEECQLDIYYELFETLSQEYTELLEAHETLREVERAQWEADWRE